ncbi:transposase [Thermoplasma sp. Kam2015]|uniref:RNA-guided endonuclease InsQ/TnpB family protein n=1 Tax=Thermoplasma sp. Kam2015 TaxID=2094122 RepID=UPI000D90A303|nr:RNA-guided endonuclease TnpB family protein [Thermoplasma sp. Kam2015]PYB69128.1 transposase [Thermoplasma sp. Kam2015]
MRIILTEQIFIRDNGVISRMCHVSKNLYNQVNYILRNQFFNKEKLSSYKDLAKQFSKPSGIEENNNFQKLPAQTAQWTIRKVKESWNSFFKALKTYKKHPELFDGIPKPPKYKNKDGEFILIFTNQQCSIDNGILKFPKIMDLEVKTRLDDVDLREVQIIPLGIGYNVEIVYSKEISDVSELSPKRILGIDIGVMNIVTIGNNISEKGIAVKGGVLKSINQYFNKELSRLKSINDRQRKNRENTKRINRLYLTRNRKIKDIMHKLSKAVIEYAMNNKIDTIVIGHNNRWKQSVDIGKENNQNFVQIPFNMLIQQIKYKAEEKGINVMIQEESYTSICSFLDNESIEHHDTYMGKRIKRGVFQSANGTLIHADLNASYNTIRKAIPEAFDGIEGIGLYPRSLSIKEMITSKGGC